MIWTYFAFERICSSGRGSSAVSLMWTVPSVHVPSPAESCADLGSPSPLVTPLSPRREATRQVVGLRSGGSSASFRRCQRKVNRAVVDAGIPLVRDGSGVVRRNLFGRPAHSVTSTQVLCGPAGWRSRMIQQDVVRASSRRDLPLKRNLLADLSAARLTRGATASGGSDHGDGSRQIRPGPAPVQPRRRCDRTTRRGRRQPPYLRRCASCKSRRCAMRRCRTPEPDGDVAGLPAVQALHDARHVAATRGAARPAGRHWTARAPSR